MAERAIEPHIPVWDVEPKPGRLPNAAFEYDPERDRLICPEGKTLKTTGRINEEHCKTYIASIPSCRGCPLKETCCPGRDMRTIRRSIYEDARAYTRSIAGTPSYEKSLDERKKVEMSFAQLKRTLGITRMRLRGLANAADEMMLGAIALNLRKLAKYAWRPVRLPI